MIKNAASFQMGNSMYRTLKDIRITFELAILFKPEDVQLNKTIRNTAKEILKFGVDNAKVRHKLHEIKNSTNPASTMFHLTRGVQL